MIVNMKTDDIEGYRIRSTDFLKLFKRGCIRCGPVDFLQAKKMRIKTGVIFWNLVFFMMVTCVRGKKNPLMSYVVMHVLLLVFLEEDDVFLYGKIRLCSKKALKKARAKGTHLLARLQVQCRH